MIKIARYSKFKEYSISKLQIEKKGKRRIAVVIAKCSVSVGAYEVLKAIQNTLKEERIEDIIVEITGCMGLCNREPIIMVEGLDGSKTIYDWVTPEKASIITLVHGLYGKPVWPWAMIN